MYVCGKTLFFFFFFFLKTCVIIVLQAVDSSKLVLRIDEIIFTLMKKLWAYV